jgi:hypothetical protein
MDEEVLQVVGPFACIPVINLCAYVQDHNSQSVFVVVFL